MKTLFNFNPTLKIIAACAATLLFAGCAQVAPERFYALNTTAIMPDVVYPKVTQEVVVRVQDVPEIVDRTQLVLIDNSSQVQILENERWAETLKSGMTRAIVANLASALPKSVVTSNISNDNKAWQVTIRITQMQANNDGNVILQARWAVKNDTGKVLDNGHIELQQALPNNPQPAQIVSTWSHQLAQLSGAIAKTLGYL